MLLFLTSLTFVHDLIKLNPSAHQSKKIFDDQCMQGGKPVDAVDINSGSFTQQKPMNSKQAYGCFLSIDKHTQLKDCRLLIFSCNFTDIKYADIGYNGGAIYIDDDNYGFNEKENYVENCRFIRCSSNNGGAIYIRTSASVDSCIFYFINDYFEENDVEYGNGGAVHFTGQYLVITKSTFINNKAGNKGGDVYFQYNDNNEGMKLDIQNCTFIQTTNANSKPLIYINSVSKYNIDFTFINNRINLSTNSVYLLDHGDTYGINRNVSGNYLAPFDTSLLHPSLSYLYKDYFEEWIIEQEPAVTEKPVEPTEEKTIEPTEEKPVEPTEEKPIDPTEEKPVEPTEEKPIDPTEEKPIDPTEEKPVEPTEEKPVEPTEEKPVDPTEEKPVEPTEEKPIEPTEEKPVEPTEPPTYVTFVFSNSTNGSRYEDKDNRKVLVEILTSNFTNFTRNNENGGSVYLINCGFKSEGTIFYNCSSPNGGGGAIYIRNSFYTEKNLTFINLQFIICSAIYGGAVYVKSASTEESIIFQSCTFLSNQATGDSNKKDNLYGGSAIYLAAPSCFVINCTYNRNKGSGGAFKCIDDFDTTLNLRGFLQRQQNNAIVISSCQFIKVDEEISESLIYLVNKKENARVEVHDCSFAGKLNKGSYYIDGNIPSNEKSKVFIDSCKFDYDIKLAVNSNLLNKESLNDKRTKQSKSFIEDSHILWLSFTFFCILVIATAFYVLKLSKRLPNGDNNNDLTKSFDLNDDSRKNSETII